MKKQFLTKVGIAVFTVCLAVTNLNAQNRVNNYNFSEASKAPRNFSQINLANGWSNANQGTADFYHKNASKCSNMGVPENKAGSQEAFNGDGYAGIIAYFDDEVLTFKNGMPTTGSGYNKYSEFLTTQLSSPLEAGRTYTVKFRVSLSEHSGRAVSGLGAHLSKEPLNQSNNSFIMVTPQVKSDELIDSRDKWVEISGLVTAKGGEQYITVGLFNGPGEVKRAVAMNVTNNKRAYYFVDGVEVLGSNEKDTDGDGIVDSKDDCPKVKGVKENNGCPPDSDGDGIADNVDKCPDVKGVKENNGCPADRDGDGVADVDDECPDLKGSPKYNGCALSKEEAKIIKDASANIYFETGSSVIKKSSYADLDKLVAILKKHPEVKARVEGHTDNTGNAAKNMTLSKARAKSVADYLISHGEPADHISSEGYGITRPVATNDTKEGRAKNRRVEIVVSSYEEK